MPVLAPQFGLADVVRGMIVPTERPKTDLIGTAVDAAVGAVASAIPESLKFSKTPTSSRPELDRMIKYYAELNGLPLDLVHRVVKRESNYNPRAYSKGNYGLMQIRYNTAKGLGYEGSAEGLFDAETNLKYATRYLRGAWMVADNKNDGAVKLYASGYYYHVTAGVDADAAPVDALEQLQDASRSGTEIEQAVDRLVADHRLERRLDIAFGDMQTSELVPFGRVAAEIGLRLLGSGSFQRSKTDCVPRQNCIVGRGRGEQFPDQRDATALLPQTEIGPGAFLVSVDERDFGEQFKMAGNTRLRLTENFGKIGHRQVAGREQRQQAHVRPSRKALP